MSRMNSCIPIALVAALCLSSSPAGEVDKLLDVTLLKSTPERYRWSEGSILALDGKQHLVMAVTGFGGGGHDHSGAEILEFHSRDGGLTWSALEEAVVLQANVGKQTVMNPSLLRLDTGELLCFVSVKHSTKDCGVWVKRSRDDGQTWGDLKRLPYKGYGGVGCDRALQISTGRIVLPAWLSMNGLGSTHAYCLYSDDRGHTWQKTALVTTPTGSTGRKTNPAAEEPMVIELRDGRLMMFMRTYLKSIYRSFSADGGETWSKPESSGIPSPGSMSTIKRLPTGDILLLWNWARLPDISGPWPRIFMSSAISTDEGRNFSSVRHLDGAADFPGKITMANVTFSGGNAIITYSKSMTKKNAYNWRLQVVPIKWFYEGDMTLAYGENYRPELNAFLGGKGPAEAAPATRIPRPAPPDRASALAKVSGDVAPDAADAGLVASYHFEAGKGQFAFDTSPGLNDLWFGPAAGAPKWVSAEHGGGIEFASRSNFLLTPHSASLAFPDGTFSLAATIRPTSVKARAVLATKNHAFEVGLLGGRLQAAVRSGGSWGPGWLGSTPVSLNRWSDVAVTYDGRRLRFYLNDQLVETVSRRCRMTGNEETFAVGGCSHIDDSSFVGRIRRLRVWNSVQYQSEGEPRMKSGTTAPRRVDGTHQLFIEDSLIESSEGLSRVVNQPAKYHGNPVLTYEHPWEGNCVITWGSVLWDEREKRFRVWYEAYKKHAAPGDQTILCYATSVDGIHWEKPDLGLVEWQGSTENNIVFAPADGSIDAPTVLRVLDAPADRRYRMYWYSGKHKGIRGATSPDGLKWQVLDSVLVAAGDRSSAWYDEARRRFCVITRIPGRGLRTCGLWESSDGEKFEAVGEIAAPDESDPEKTEFYGMIPFRYAGLRLGFLEMFDVPGRKLNTQLVHCRENEDWQRTANRQVFLDRGAAGTWDQAWVTPSQNPPIRVGEQLYIFYQGRQTLHWADPPFGHIGSVGLAFLRPDGFVSLDAQNAEGSVVTTPLLLTAATLHLNAVARPGTIRVAVLDMAGDPVPGFTLEDCRPISGDSLDHRVSWRPGSSLAELRDTPLRLRFALQGAKLFSFWVESPAGQGR
ncbi:MAG: hypothetical protein HN904_20605 [Victivallales bacterium]|nr:hypothetical protein [Victivallales bacterium]